MRRSIALLNRMATLTRLVLAVALLGGVWLAATGQLDRAARAARAQHDADRAQLVHTLAAAPSGWLQAGLDEARSLAAGLRSGAPQTSVDAYLAAPHAFGRSLLIVDRTQRVVAASPDRLAEVGRPFPVCLQNGDSGRTIDAAASALLDAARQDPILSGFMDSPGNCNLKVVAAAAPSSTLTAVLFAPAADASATLRIARTLPNPSALRLVDAAGSAIAADGTLDSADAAAIAVDVPGGYRVQLAEPAAPLPGLPIARIVLGLAFAVVLALLIVFDIWRRRARSRAEVAKDAFLTVAGHELRTPLTVLRGFVETLAARWDDVDDDRRHMLVDKMVPHAHRLGRVIERVLLASNMQARKHARPVVVPVDLTDPIERVAERFRAEAPLHRFVTVVEPDARNVLADATALETVLEHLVDNAVKYSPAGGRIEIRTERSSRAIRVSVSDEGVGLPADVAHIFELFSQGESVDRRVHDEGGAGLGLFIVRTLVSGMGGVVRAQRRSPTGARFVVSLRPAPARRVVGAST